MIECFGHIHYLYLGVLPLRLSDRSNGWLEGPCSKLLTINSNMRDHYYLRTIDWFIIPQFFRVSWWIVSGKCILNPLTLSGFAPYASYTVLDLKPQFSQHLSWSALVDELDAEGRSVRLHRCNRKLVLSVYHSSFCMKPVPATLKLSQRSVNFWSLFQHFPSGTAYRRLSGCSSLLCARGYSWAVCWISCIGGSWSDVQYVTKEQPGERNVQ